MVPSQHQKALKQVQGVGLNESVSDVELGYGREKMEKRSHGRASVAFMTPAHAPVIACIPRYKFRLSDSSQI